MVAPLARACARALRHCSSSASGGSTWRSGALEGRSVLRLEGADVFPFLQARPLY
jgi:hypothetical protein